MIRTIYLHGAARQRFGGPFRMDVATIAEAVRALTRQIPGLLEFMRGADWKVIRGTKAKGEHADETMLELRMGAIEELHFAPIPAGAKSKGMAIGKIVLGVALIAAAIVFAPAGAGLAAAAFSVGTTGISVSFASIAMLGASMVLAGVSGLLTPTPKTPSYSARETPAERPSFLFQGPVNNTELGAAIGIACGLDILCGSVVVSAGIATETIPPGS